MCFVFDNFTPRSGARFCVAVRGGVGGGVDIVIGTLQRPVSFKRKAIFGLEIIELSKFW